MKGEFVVKEVTHPRLEDLGVLCTMQAREFDRFAKGLKSEGRKVTDIIELARQYGRYGCRRIAALLRDAGWQVNDERVERLWRREGLKVPGKQPKQGHLWLNDGSCIRLARRAGGPCPGPMTSCITGPMEALDDIAVVLKATAEQVSQNRAGVAGNRDRCVHGAVSFVPIVGSGGNVLPRTPARRPTLGQALALGGVHVRGWRTAEMRRRDRLRGGLGRREIQL